MYVPNETISHRANLNIIHLTDTPGYNKLISLFLDKRQAALVMPELAVSPRMKVRELSRVGSQIFDNPFLCGAFV